MSRTELLSRKQVAEIAGVHPGTVKRWECRDKALTPIRINSRVVRYDKVEVDKLLEVQEMTIREAKQIVTINSVWEVYNLPGKPGKSCKAPHRKDRSPSFSVYEDGRRFKDFGTGENGDVINFISLIKGIPEAQAYKDLFNLAGAGSNIPKLPLKLKDKEKTQSEYFNYYQNLRRGTTYEMYELAELRGIGFNGIKLAHDRGHLRFTSSKAGIIWALADLRGSFRQDRLLSGKKLG